MSESISSSPLTISLATPADASELLAIYAPYVRETAITFEYDVPSVEEFTGRIAHTLERFPYLTARRGGEILGYAYVSPFKERAAYDWAVETSIYVKMDLRREGVGTALYESLEKLLRRQGILNLNACIAYPNPASLAFHERFGYKTCAHFTRCGYKLGQWWDMVWMEKMLAPHPDAPSPVLPISAIDISDL